ncbi:MAG: penicillin acylase family protein [Gemmatimonadota bacterium]|jgi:penicillin amidase
MRNVVRGLVVLGALTAVLGSLWLHRVRSGPGSLEGTVEVPGLGTSVTVLRDSLGIPHLWAESLSDLAFAQGFVTARDRLWQMELFRRVASGRLSELFGSATLETDRFLRTLGMAEAAARQAETLDARERDLLRAYADGINAALDRWRGPLPPEFVVLRARPGPWSVADVIVVEKVMAFDLSEYRSGLDYLGAVRALGPEKAREVKPRYPAWAPTIVDGWPPEEGTGGGDGQGEGGVGEGREGDALAVPAVFRLARSALPPSGAAAFLEVASAVRASNAWVVGPRRSRSGKPLLANDMHLSLDAPTIWYLVGLHGPGLDVVGMSLPGTFGVVAGHTPAVAWGFTNAVVDDADFFVERVDPADSARYLAPGGSLPFSVRHEVIAVRGRRSDTLIVRATRHGPVVTPVEPAADGRVLALRWAAHDPSSSARAILGLNTARSVAEVLDALRDFTNPHQNVVFADTAGRWGYWMAGRVPLRRRGGPPLLPVPGWTGEHDWVGDLPFEEHPHVLEPDEGFVVTANNRQTRDPVGALVTDGTWLDPWRAIRIRRLLEARPVHDAASLHRIQLDVGSAFVTRHLSRVADAFRAADRPALAERLAEWDGLADLEGDEATLFHAWFEGVRMRYRHDLYGSDDGFLSRSAVSRALERGGVAPAHLADAAADAARYAGTPWGEANLLHLEHPLASVPVVGALFGFGHDDVSRPGGPYSPNVALRDGVEPPFRGRAGVSQRHVVDMADPDGSGGFVIAGGQSGWPASPHAWDQLDRWREGGLVPLPLGRAAVEARTVERFRLAPPAGG